MKLFYIFLATSCFAVPRRNNTTTENPEITPENETSIVDKKSRIINGSPVLDARSFPSYASIRRFGNDHLCGGVILDEYRILTATHCDINTNWDTVIVGWIKRDGSDKQQELKIKTVWNHPDYIPEDDNGNTILENDITVIELDSAIDFNASDVEPIEIGNEEEFGKVRNEMSDCQIVGHGYIDGQNSVVDQLHVTNQVYTTDKCQNYRDNSGQCFLTRGKAGYSQACQGDSGGPLYCDVGTGNKLFGIVSFVKTTRCDKGLTGLTSPMKYTSFIEDTYPYDDNACPSFKLHLILAFIFTSTLL